MKVIPLDFIFPYNMKGVGHKKLPEQPNIGLIHEVAGNINQCAKLAPTKTLAYGKCTLFTYMTFYNKATPTL